MSQAADIALNDCGCCAGIGVETPMTIYNRPGLGAVAYRVASYASIRRSLLASLSDGRWPILRRLRVREHDDFTIALLDAFAVVGDVLTFYQERIANESYLGTATERLSILEQARLLGYRLAPGLAAGVYLAFTMETSPGAPEQAPAAVELQSGTRAQSVPGADELPQVFETVEAIEARPRWNALMPQLTEAQTLAWDMTELWLDGADLTLAVGDALLIIAAAGGIKQASLRRVTRISVDGAAKRTGVTLAPISTAPETVSSLAQGVFVMRANAAPFGHNAPKEATYSSGVFNGFAEWNLDGAEMETRLTLSARNDKLLAGSWAVVEQFVFDSHGGLVRKWKFSQVQDVTHLAVARYGMAGSATRLTFLNGAWEKSVTTLEVLRSMTVTAQSEELAAAPLPVTYPVYGSTVALNSRVDGLSAGRPIAISGKAQRLRITRFAPVPTSEPPPANMKFPLIGAVAEALQHPRLYFSLTDYVDLEPGDRLTLAAPPEQVVGLKLVPLTPAEFGARLRENPLALFFLRLTDRDGRTGAALLFRIWLAPDAPADDDSTVSEIAFVDADPTTAIAHDRDRTTLKLQAPLAYVYERSTVRINANVALATHGESVKEPLGSGDATVPYQSFTLRQPPLTHVSAATPSGSESTLKVYVNDVLWQEVPFLYGHGPNEHIYVTSRDDAGYTTIRFGDGLTGARLPTGQNNVRAEYRKGTGLDGLVNARQVSQLMSRPLGLKEVINPRPAEGAEDPESRDEARRNAPTTVLTLDRAVSLQDYEDFSRTFAGVAKANAVWVWDGRRRSIFLTVAGPEGEILEEDGVVIGKLKSALREYGDPYVAFTIKSYRPALFQIHGTVTVAEDHVQETVLAAVAAALQERYSFEARDFGRPVALSEAVAVIQSVAGVVAVDIDKFYRNDAPSAPLQSRLAAERPALGADGVVPAAELLLLDESSLNQLKAAT